jgi:TonB family protein
MLSPRQQLLLHWLPPGGVSLLLNLLLLHALGLTLLPRGLAVLDSVLSVELEPASAPPRQRVVAPAPLVSETAAPTPRAQTPAEPETAETGEQDPPRAGNSPTIEPLHRVTRLPAFLRRVEPDYPESERALGRQARVLAEVTLGDDGGIIDLQILRSGGPTFDAAVIAALRNSRFAPALIQNRSVSVRFQVPFQFKLD